MKWAKERDSLIAQTRAFVNSVIAWKTDTTPPSGSVEPVTIENAFADRLREEFEQIDAPEKLEEAVEKSETEEKAAEPVQALPMTELPAPPKTLLLAPPAGDALQKRDTPRKEATVHSDVRKEIETRVAAFQAHQRRFAREREAYFNSVLTKARSSLNHDDGDRSEPSA